MAFARWQRVSLHVCLSFVVPVAGLLGAASVASADTKIEGERKQWHDVRLTFAGPKTSETADPNPFRDYRLNVTFTKGAKTYVVPGYFAADGNAAESGATEGDKWRVHFTPDEVGSWSYRVSFRTGKDVAILPKQVLLYRDFVRCVFSQ